VDWGRDVKLVQNDLRLIYDRVQEKAGEGRREIGPGSYSECSAC
jgi:hypothetical protein